MKNDDKVQPPLEPLEEGSEGWILKKQSQLARKARHSGKKRVAMESNKEN